MNDDFVLFLQNSSTQRPTHPAARSTDSRADCSNPASARAAVHCTRASALRSYARNRAPTTVLLLLPELAAIPGNTDRTAATSNNTAAEKTPFTCKPALQLTNSRHCIYRKYIQNFGHGDPAKVSQYVRPSRQHCTLHCPVLGQSQSHCPRQRSQ